MGKKVKVKITINGVEEEIEVNMPDLAGPSVDVKVEFPEGPDGKPYIAAGRLTKFWPE